MRRLCVLFLVAFAYSVEISTWAAQWKKVRFTDDDTHPYQISVERVSSTTPDEPYHCKAFGRTVGYNKSQELFRLDTHLAGGSTDRQESVLKNLLHLNLEEQIIDFETSNKDYYVISSLNKVYFMKYLQGKEYSKPSSTNLPDSAKNSVEKGDFFLLVIENGIAIIFANESFACHGSQCSYISGWQSIVTLTHAAHMKAKNGKQYILISLVTGFSIMEYNGQGQVSNINTYNASLFNRTAVGIYDINPEGTNESSLYVLDYEQGVYMVRYQQHDPTKVVKVEHVLNISQCFSMDNVGYQYFILICRRQVDQSDYIVEVHFDQKEKRFTSLIPKNQQFSKIVDVQLTPNYYVSWARSGFKFFWMSTNIHYPEQYRKAGELFFYNTIRARFKSIQNKEYLYYATPNSVQRLAIQEVPAYVICQSPVSTEEVYNIRYAVPCQDDQQKTCTKTQVLQYEATKHTQISIVFGVLPLILSFLGLILIVILIVIIFCEFRKKERELLQKSEIFETEVNDLGDMMAPPSAR